jgi:hypothetical protein
MYYIVYLFISWIVKVMEFGVLFSINLETEVNNFKNTREMLGSVNEEFANINYVVCRHSHSSFDDASNGIMLHELVE